MNITEQLKELKNIKPRQEWVETQRALLLSQITAQVTEKSPSVLVDSWLFAKSIMPNGFLRFVARPVGVMTMLAVALFSTGMLGVNASKGSLPGDFLYPVKLTSENVQVGLAIKETKKAELHMQFAEERVKEISQVAKSNIAPAEKADKIKQATDVLKVDLQKVQNHLEVTKQNPAKAKEAVTAAQVVDNKTAAINAQLTENKDELKKDAGNQAVIKALNEAGAAATATAVKAVSVIVDKQESGDVKLPENELVDNIVQKISQVEATMANAAQTMDNATAVNGTLPVVNASPLSDVNATQPQQAQQILTEAKTLLDQGDLSSAVDKIQQGATIAQEVTQTAGQK